MGQQHQVDVHGCLLAAMEKKMIVQLVYVDEESSLLTYYIQLIIIVHMYTAGRYIRTSKPSNNGHLYAQSWYPHLLCVVKCKCVALVWMRNCI